MGVEWGNRRSNSGARILPFIQSKRPRPEPNIDNTPNHPSQVGFVPNHDGPDHDDICPACDHDVYHDPDDGCSHYYNIPGFPDYRCRCTRPGTRAERA